MVVSALLLFVPVLDAKGAGGGSTSNNPAAVPSPVSLPAGHPGGTVSASLIVYFANASKPTSLVLVQATMLQTKNGLEISNSSVTVSPSTPVNIPGSGTTTLTVTVHIPSVAKPGNYTGQLILVGANGGVGTVSISLGVSYNLSQYVYNYGWYLLAVMVGVIASFVYSPLGNPKDQADQAEQTTPQPAVVQGEQLDQMSNDPPVSESTKARTGSNRLTQWYWSRPKHKRKTLNSWLGHLPNLTHWAILYSSIAISIIVAFFLTTTPVFGPNFYQNLALSFFNGFAVHRVLDGTVPGAKDGTKPAAKG